MNNSATQKKPVDQDWHSADVLASVRKKGWSLQQLALASGYARGGSLNKALREPYPKAERIIAECIGIEPRQIWPSRYNRDGTPNRTRGMKPMRPAHLRVVPKPTTGTSARNPQDNQGE